MGLGPTDTGEGNLGAVTVVNVVDLDDVEGRDGNNF